MNRGQRLKKHGATTTTPVLLLSHKLRADRRILLRKLIEAVEERRAEFLHGSVYAITTRFRDDSTEEYQAPLRRDAWKVVLPELAFQPAPFGG